MVKSWYCGNKYSQKLYPQNAPSQILGKVLNMPRVLNVPGFGICLWF